MISIIIPTYNEEKYVRDAVDQFKVLDAKEFEIIVTDDKSTDKTVEIAKSTGVKVIEAPTKYPAIGANRNVGAKVARGEYLAFFDCDSRVEDPKAFFSRCLYKFSSRPNMLAMTAKLNVLPEHETLMDSIVYFFFNETHILKNNYLHIGEASGKFQMIRREAFERLGGYREDLISREDADMFQRLNKIGETYCDPKQTVFHYGRRAHKIGWPKLLWIWMRDAFMVATHDKSGSKVWEDVR